MNTLNKKQFSNLNNIFDNLFDDKDNLKENYVMELQSLFSTNSQECFAFLTEISLIQKNLLEAKNNKPKTDKKETKEFSRYILENNLGSFFNTFVKNFLQQYLYISWHKRKLDNIDKEVIAVKKDKKTYRFSLSSLVSDDNWALSTPLNHYQDGQFDKWLSLGVDTYILDAKLNLDSLRLQKDILNLIFASIDSKDECKKQVTRVIHPSINQNKKELIGKSVTGNLDFKDSILNLDVNKILEILEIKDNDLTVNDITLLIGILDYLQNNPLNNSENFKDNGCFSDNLKFTTNKLWNKYINKQYVIDKTQEETDKTQEETDEKKYKTVEYNKNTYYIINTYYYELRSYKYKIQEVKRFQSDSTTQFLIYDKWHKIVAIRDYNELTDAQKEVLAIASNN